jgi:hypothetical protein
MSTSFPHKAEKERMAFGANSFYTEYTTNELRSRKEDLL